MEGVDLKRYLWDIPGALHFHRHFKFDSVLRLYIFIAYPLLSQPMQAAHPIPSYPSHCPAMERMGYDKMGFM